MIPTFLRPWLLLLVGLVACAAPRPMPLAFQLDQVSDRHRPAFDALLGALDRRDHREAQAVLDGLLARLESEAASSDETLALEVGWQLDAARRFQNILGGRQRVESLTLDLAVEDRDGALRLILSIKSQHPAPLELRPGSAVFEREGLFMGPDGKLNVMGSTSVLRGEQRWELPPLGRLEVDLGPYSPPSLGGALAERDGFALRLGSGSVLEDGVTYPAERWPVPRGMRVNLASFLPSGALGPEPLLALLDNPEASMPARIERTVRIRPADYAATLAALGPKIDGATPEIFERYAPLLAWLCMHRPQPQGLDAWREHLRSVPEPRQLEPR
ncbi:MAG: hypothetical protein H6830_03800 [Planctomycetes bacterium]|nr:hypothetical protein [Planctomycetota bacterium]